MTALGILHLTTFLQGGAGRAITDLACAQHAAGHHVTVVTSHTPQGEFGNYPEYLERLQSAGVTLHAIDSLFTRDLALNSRVAGVLRQTVKAAGVSVIHAHAAVPALIGRLYAGRSARSIPVVQTQHGWGTSKTAQQAAFDVEMLRRVDAVITTSGATRNLLVRYGAPADAIQTIPCGLAAAAEPGDPPADASRAAEPFRRRELSLVGCIGSVTANKNQQLVVRALPQLRDAGVAAVFVGEGRDALVAEARAAGVTDRVLACGYQPHASRWLPLFDALVVPSRSEGQGLVVLEAFRAGVPVIASNIPALAELIDDGRSGFLFEQDDARALAEVVARVLGLTDAERRAVTTVGRARFLAEFTLERMVARHEALYRGVIRDGVRGGAGGEDTEGAETTSTRSPQRAEMTDVGGPRFARHRSRGAVASQASGDRPGL